MNGVKMKKRIAALAGVLAIAAVAPASAAPVTPEPALGLGTAATTPAADNVIANVPANPAADVNPGAGVDTVVTTPVAP
jgi:long-subunit fatty acid transport protein